jgi:prephenate dehydratase
VAAYLGPEGTFTHQAATVILGNTPLLQPISTVPAVIDALLSNEANYAVIPMENTVEGIVTASMDQLVFGTDRLVILQEVSIPITFNSYRSRSGSAAATVAGSHPHGLAQCREYVRSTGLMTEHFSSTAAAVEAAASRPELLAIGAPGLESEYDVAVVERQVEDHKGAYTRFACVGRITDSEVLPPPDHTTMTWKTTLVLTPGSSRPGMLAELCTHFADQEINIISLTSRPLPGFAGAYTFIVSLECDRHSPHLARSLASVFYSGVRIKYLGSYLSDYATVDASRERSLAAPVGSLGLHDFEKMSALFPADHIEVVTE